MNGECVFCESLKSHKRAARFSELNHEYSVAIVIRSWRRDQGKRFASRSIDLRYRGLGYKLKFCPECGRRLK